MRVCVLPCSPDTSHAATTITDFMPLQPPTPLSRGQTSTLDFRPCTASSCTGRDRCVCVTLLTLHTHIHTGRERAQPLPVPALLRAEGSGCWRVTTTLLFSTCCLQFSRKLGLGSRQAAAVVVKRWKRRSHVFSPLSVFLVHRSPRIQTSAKRKKKKKLQN